MKCKSCSRANRAESKFCRFCGEEISKSAFTKKDVPQKKNEDHLELSIKLPKVSLNSLKSIFLSGRSRKTAYVLAGILIFGTVAYAAPKAVGYFQVESAVNKVESEQELGNYESNISLIEKAEEKWMFPSQEEKLASLKEAQVRYIEYRDIVASAEAKESEGLLKEARALLQEVAIDYPFYEEEVRSKLSGLQGEIETNLDEARLAAEARARAEAAAKASAQAAAAAAAQAKAASDAAAAAAAEQARQSEYQRQQAEYQRQQERAEKEEQVKISFVNQLTSIYNSYSDGVDYYNDAMSEYNAGNDYVALAVFGQALAVFKGMRQDALDLGTSFSGLPYEYESAAEDMASVGYYMTEAINEITSVLGTNLPSQASYWTNLANPLVDSVYYFLLKNS